MNRLRLELLKITDNGNPLSHPCLIEKLRLKIPHSIKVLESSIDIDRYTCILYVFNIMNDEEYITLAQKCPKNIYANTEFIQFLINHNYLNESFESQINYLIVYYENEKVKHIGRLIDKELAISKWGTGHLYQHPIFEVPSSFGTEIRLFLPLNREDILSYFIEYAELKGVSFKE